MFFSRADYAAYLRMLRENADLHHIEVFAYCLMPNHVHLVLVPAATHSLHRALKALHGHYAQRINRIKNLKGHLWQDRYFSSPLDSDYFVNAVRYVELNPVRAHMVAKAEDYAWSSAAGHCRLRNDPVIDPRPGSHLIAGISDWSRWLGAGVVDESVATLRRHGSQNLPCGSSKFIDLLEESAGRTLRYRPRGAPPRVGSVES